MEYHGIHNTSATILPGLINNGGNIRRNNEDEDEHHKHEVKEMDFFKEATCSKAISNEDEDATMNLEIKGIQDGEINGDDLKLQIDTGLKLQTSRNMGFVDKSTVDDEVKFEEHDENQISTKAELVVLKAEIARKNIENQRLKILLNQVTNSYQALQMQIFTIRQHQLDQNKSGNVLQTQMADDDDPSNEKRKQQMRQFLDIGDDDQSNRRDEKEDDSANTSKNSKLNYMQRNGNSAPIGEAEETHEITMRRARVSVRARSEANMITDGCHWRKYGQKLAKGNPCPRAYYRCTMGPTCPVRKQVQRCADDRGILITTYEGHHNHPLPSAAVSIATTTTAAASMLIAGSKSSPMDGLISPSVFSQPTALPGLPSLATISASAPFPTITLDLTGPQPQGNSTNIATANMSGLGSVGPMQQLLGQALHSLHGSSGPIRDNDNESPSVDPIIVAKAVLAADPTLATALATAISSLIKDHFHPNNVDINNDDENVMTNNPDFSNFVEN